jgi:hypothetical protein
MATPVTRLIAPSLAPVQATVLGTFTREGELDVIARANRDENLVVIAINKTSGFIHIC